MKNAALFAGVPAVLLILAGCGIKPIQPEGAKKDGQAEQAAAPVDPPKIKLNIPAAAPQNPAAKQPQAAQQPPGKQPQGQQPQAEKQAQTKPPRKKRNHHDDDIPTVTANPSQAAQNPATTTPPANLGGLRFKIGLAKGKDKETNQPAGLSPTTAVAATGGRPKFSAPGGPNSLGVTHPVAPEDARFPFALQPGLNRLALSPDGHLLVTQQEGSWAANVWELTDGMSLAGFLLHGPASGLVISPNSQFLAALHGPDEMPTLSVWEIRTGRELFNQPMMAGVANAHDPANPAAAPQTQPPAASPKANVAVGAPAAPTTAPNGKNAATTAAAAEPSATPARLGGFTADSRSIVYLWQSNVHVVDVISGAADSLNAHAGVVAENHNYAAVACSPVDAAIVAVSLAGEKPELQVRNNKTFEVVQKIAGADATAELFFSGDGKRLMGASATTGVITVWDTSTWKLTAEIKPDAGKTAPAAHLRTNAPGTILAGITPNSQLWLWNVDSKKPLLVRGQFTPRDLAVSPAGPVVFAQNDGSLQIIGIDDGGPLKGRFEKLSTLLASAPSRFEPIRLARPKVDDPQQALQMFSGQLMRRIATRLEKVRPQGFLTDLQGLSSQAFTPGIGGVGTGIDGAKAAKKPKKHDRDDDESNTVPRTKAGGAAANKPIPKIMIKRGRNSR